MGRTSHPLAIDNAKIKIINMTKIVFPERGRGRYSGLLLFYLFYKYNFDPPGGGLFFFEKGTGGKDLGKRLYN